MTLKDGIKIGFGIMIANMVVNVVMRFAFMLMYGR